MPRSPAVLNRLNVDNDARDDLSFWLNGPFAERIVSNPSPGNSRGGRFVVEGYDENRVTTWQLSIGPNVPPWRASPAR